MSARIGQIRWSSYGLQTYKSVGDAMRELGFRPIRSIEDGDGQSAFTFWQRHAHMLISQVFADTGDVCVAVRPPVSQQEPKTGTEGEEK